MDPEGEIYVSRHSVGKFHHSSFLSGDPVAAAGEVVVKNGLITKVTDKSGHYQPGPEQMLNLTQRLQGAGVQTESIKMNSQSDDQYGGYSTY